MSMMFALPSGDHVPHMSQVLVAPLCHGFLINEWGWAWHTFVWRYWIPLCENTHKKLAVCCWQARYSILLIPVTSIKVKTTCSSSFLSSCKPLHNSVKMHSESFWYNCLFLFSYLTPPFPFFILLLSHRSNPAYRDFLRVQFCLLSIFVVGTINKHLGSLFGISVGFYGSTVSKMTGAIGMAAVASHSNDKHVPVWTKLCQVLHGCYPFSLWTWHEASLFFRSFIFFFSCFAPPIETWYPQHSPLSVFGPRAPAQ